MMKWGIDFIRQHQRDLLTHQLSEVISSWILDWLTPCTTAIETIDEFTSLHAELVQQNGFFGISNEKVLGILAISSERWKKLFFAPIAEDIPNDEILYFLIQKAQSDLLQRILVGLESSQLEDIPSHNYQLDTSYFIVVIRIKVGIEELSIILDSQYLATNDNLRIKKEVLTNRIEAIQDETIILKASFALDSVSLSEVMNLALGDIITSSHPINRPFQLTNNQQPVATGNLAKAKNAMALVISNHPSS